MISFSTKNGDVEMTNTIVMCSDAELLRQKVQRCLATNEGEWWYDETEGIDFSVILKKNPREDEIRHTIEEELIAIDSTFIMTAFSLRMEGRKAVISFSAVNADGVEVGGEQIYG